jgi:dTDP-4-amino-4,6-dideoxygalactose transaminase
VRNIPPVDLKRQYQSVKEELDRAVLSVLSSGRYIGGATVTDFEQEFASYTGAEHCVSCNSGTDALYLALRALNIGFGDEVITTAFTFIATAEVISQVGATPVFVDIEPTTFNLDCHKIEAAITGKTRAIITVHLFGQPTEMTQLMAIARKYNLFVIEDCAQATGAIWGREKVGSIGDVGCFSFFPTKNLGGCGDGGAITSNNRAIADGIRMLKEHGSRERYLHEAIGVNSRLDSLQAAILLVKLPYLDQWNNQRRQVASIYGQLLTGLPYITLPQELSGGQGVWNQYTIRIAREDQNFESYRDEVRKRLQEKGVSSMVYYPLPLHLQPVYRGNHRVGELPLTEKAAHEVLSLPMFPDMSFEEQQQVVLALKESL